MEDRFDAFRALLPAAVDTSPFLVVAMDSAGRILFMNATGGRLLDLPVEEVLGHNVFDFLPAEDAERALTYLGTLSAGGGLPTGVTRFSVRRADGTPVPFEATAQSLDVGGERVVVAWARSLAGQVTIEQLVHSVLSEPLPVVLRRACDFVLWSDWGSQVGIAWSFEDAHHVVTTGMPDELATGRHDRSPWARARTSGAEQRTDRDELDGARRELAEQLGIRELQVVPVPWGAPEPALITIWTRGDGRTPEHHALGVEQLAGVAELVLRFGAQTAELHRAARVDALTGLANRRTFFEQLEGLEGTGAVLYCDLDGFKAANDTYGHTTGDAVLQIVARRIESLTRDGDLIARLGGDEFVVLCPGLPAEGATALAERLRSALDDPVVVEGTPIELGLSVGVAVAQRIDEAAVEAADAALYADKATRGRTRSDRA